MITRFYVDNYKCLTNFEYKPKPFELVLGANGTGKSTVFEALDKVRRFIAGEANALEHFPMHSGTRWDTRETQIFEIDFESKNIQFEYRLETNLASEKNRVEKETLKKAGVIQYETVWHDTPFDFDPDSEEQHQNGVRAIQGLDIDGEYSLGNNNHSAFERTRYAEYLQGFHYIKINSPLMTSQVKRAIKRSNFDLSEFASYYLYLLQQKQGQIFELLPLLREVITNFDSFAVSEDFEEARRDLQINCRRTNQNGVSKSPLRYSFDELSDGQRALIGLYTLLFCTLEEGVTLVIDEPENYIALRELQPWLMLLQERLEEKGGQVILISHHPEFINMLAPENGVVFERDAGGPVRIKSWEQGNSPLAPAEIMARGWES